MARQYTLLSQDEEQQLGIDKETGRRLEALKTAIGLIADKRERASATAIKAYHEIVIAVPFMGGWVRKSFDLFDPRVHQLLDEELAETLVEEGVWRSNLAPEELRTHLLHLSQDTWLLPAHSGSDG